MSTACANCQTSREDQLAIRAEMIAEISMIASPGRANEDTIKLVKEAVAVYDRLARGELHNVSAAPVADATIAAVAVITGRATA